MLPLILASASPQRKALLAGLGVSFSVVPSGVDEGSHPEQNPGKRAVHLSLLKAKDVASRYPDAWVIGCDTLVVADDGTLLEKPVDEADARRMMEAQSGRTSTVHSGLTLLGPSDEEATDLSSSFVTFKPLDRREIDWWMGTGMWKDRSGSFQIDGLGQLMIEKIEGDWTGIVGFPVFLFGELCGRLKISFWKS